MDDAKRQELDKLRQQIDPEILARVAGAMGEDPSAAAALSGSSPSAPASSQRGSGRLSNLKARMNLKEVIEPAENTAEAKPRHEAAFVVYDQSHFRAKQLGAFIQKMGFANVKTLSDPETFMRVVLECLNDPEVAKTSLAVYDDYYPGMMALLASSPVQKIRSALPKFDEMAIFAMVEADQDPEDIEGLDPRYLLSMRLSPEFSGKRVRRLLDLSE